MATRREIQSSDDHYNILNVILDLALTPLNEINLEHLLTDLCTGMAEALALSGVAVFLWDDATKTARLTATSDTATRDLLTESAAANLANLDQDELERLLVGDTVVSGGRSGWTAVLPMRRESNALGLLQLFTSGGRLRAQDVHAAGMVGTALAMLLFNSRNYQISNQMVVQLSGALQSRLPIEQAKGRLVERHQVDLGEAYRMLRGHARRNRISIRAAADAVVAGAGVSTPKESPGRAMRRVHGRLPD